MTSLFTFADNSQLYAVKAKWLTEIPVWEANRVMDEAHVQDLEASIRNPREIQGPFSVVTYLDETTKQPINRIIDGQHRQEVLRRYFAAVATAEDFPVLCRRYKLDDPDAARTIFEAINHAKPMVYKGSPVERLHEIVAALRKNFVVERGSTMVAMIRTGCNRPALNTEHLERALKLYGLHERTDLDLKTIVAHAEAMNGFYAEDPARIPGRYTRATFERAVEYGFYLGLDPHCSWLMGLKA